MDALWDDAKAAENKAAESRAEENPPAEK
jgi:hypothetical protein